MPLFLKNTSKESALTLKYGAGGRKVVAIPKDSEVLLPLDMNANELQTLLNLFNNQLLVVDTNKIVEKDPEESEEGPEEGSEEDPEEEDPEESEEESEEEGPEEGSEEEGPEEGSEEDPEEEDPGEEGPEEGSEEEGPEEGSEEDPEEEKIYTQKELEDLKADQVKEIATKLGIDTTQKNSNTKKELIPIILDKQKA